MIGIRRALLVSTADKYFGLLVNIGTIAVISRLLKPSEIGVSVVGTAIMTFALAVREFGSSGFLIQHHDLTRDDVRTVFTFQFLITAVIVAALLAVAPAVSSSFGQAGLEEYLYVVSAGIWIESLALPTASLLRREMAFGTLAAINISSAAASSLLSIVLAASGFSYMSMAWAWLFASVVTAALTLWSRPNLWIYRPSLRSWRNVLTFGSYGGGITILTWMSETLPQLLLGRILPTEVVGHYNRAVLICSLPDKVVMMGVSSVATPALTAEIRQGRDIKPAYLRSLGYITAIHWPGLACLCLLAHPVIQVVLGPQWLDIVPIVQILCIAGLFRFPSVITASTLIAVGAIGHTFRGSLLSLPISALMLCLASPWGPVAIATTQIAAVLLQTNVALYLVRPQVKFSWVELTEALLPSVAITFCTVLGPLAVLAAAGFQFEISLAAALVAALLAGVGWVLGVYITGHPIRSEFVRAVTSMTKMSAVLKQRSRDAPMGRKLSRQSP